MAVLSSQHTHTSMSPTRGRIAPVQRVLAASLAALVDEPALKDSPPH